MDDFKTIPPEEIGKNSKIALEVAETESDAYWQAVFELCDVIKANNEKNEDTVMIIPFGPLGPFSRWVYLINKYRLSLKRCWFINMDEYLTPSLEYIDINHPLSFRGGINKLFYDLIDPELNVPESQRFFPKPGDEGNVLRVIEKCGKLDLCFGGIGISGHIAFNEPPEPGVTMTNEEYKQLPTRILKLGRETITINAILNSGADFEAIPQDCITVGMKEIFMAKKVRVVMARDWQGAAIRRFLHGPPTCKFPCSLLQEHPDTKVYAARITLQPITPFNRIYNKVPG